MASVVGVFEDSYSGYLILCGAWEGLGREGGLFVVSFVLVRICIFLCGS